VGTASPSSILHLKGSGPRITLQDQTSDDLTAKITSSSGALYLQSRNGSSHGEIIFRTENNSAAAERARINPLGNFNINGNLAIASGNTSGDPVVDFAGLTDNGGSNWRKCGVWVMYNGIDTDATDNKSVVYYTGVGAVSTWNWVGDSDTLTNDSFGSVTLQNAAATGFRLYFDVNNQNSGSIVVMIQGWDTKPTITIN